MADHPTFEVREGGALRPLPQPLLIRYPNRDEVGDEVVAGWFGQRRVSFLGQRPALQQRVVGDPWQAVSLYQRLRRRGVTVEEYPFLQQSVGRLATTLHVAIRDHHLALPPDEELLDELANVRLRETSPGVLRLDHDPDKHDDRAIALAFGVQAVEPPRVL